MPPRHHHLRTAAERGGGLSQGGIDLGLGFNEGGERLHRDGCGVLGKRRQAGSRAARFCWCGSSSGRGKTAWLT